MSLKIKIPSIGKVNLSDNDYLSSGGEAEVYVKDLTAYKIYHNPDKMITQRKMDELSVLKKCQNVIVPQETIYDKNDKPIGFTMPFVSDTHPLCKLFTNSFKGKQNVSPEDVNTIIKKMQDILEFIHSKGILVVDLNELNLLVSEKFDVVYFIDTDSYQTESYKATAIMASIRDPLVTRNEWSEGSDWFSFAVLAFQMWIGIHPFKGSHPDYKKKEWMKRMEDGVSIFNDKASLPKMCNPLSVIPPSHYEWMKSVFEQNARTSPPPMGDISFVIDTTTNTIQVSANFEISSVFNAPIRIVDIFNVMGVKYVIGNDTIYKDQVALNFDLSKAKRTLMTSGTGFSPIVCKLEKGMLGFSNISGLEFAKVCATDVMTYGDRVYSVFEGKCYEHSFRNIGGKDVHQFKVVCNVMRNSVKVFDGVLFQAMFKKQFVIVPYETGKCSIVAMPELDGSRIIDAKCERNICVVIAEKEGIYNRHVFTFDAKFKTYTMRVDTDVTVTDVNFTVLPTGVTVMATDTDVEIFKDNHVKKIDNSPFTANNKLFNVSGTVHYIDDKEVFQASIRK
jgi:tRNA A-37 threonylcarbamoyl transferase component Bud32